MMKAWGEGKLLSELVSKLNYSVVCVCACIFRYYNMTLSTEISQSTMLLSPPLAELDS